MGQGVEGVDEAPLTFHKRAIKRPRKPSACGGVSRAAKGADCKSAGYAFAGSSPASPTNMIFLVFAISRQTSATTIR
jgi:hypothetical protein